MNSERRKRIRAIQDVIVGAIVDLEEMESEERVAQQSLPPHWRGQWKAHEEAAGNITLADGALRNAHDLLGKAIGEKE